MATNEERRRKGMQARPKIELLISCKKLRDMDRLSKSDPVCFLYSYAKAAAAADLSPTDIDDNSAWSLVGRTEMIDNNLNSKVKDFIQHCTNESVGMCFRACRSASLPAQPSRRVNITSPTYGHTYNIISLKQ